MSSILNKAHRVYKSARYVSKTTYKIKGPSAATDYIEGSYKRWKNVSLFIAFPLILLAGFNCILTREEDKEPKEFVKYEYLRIRTKRFPWGDGDHSLFHNPSKNALPGGYEKI